MRYVLMVPFFVLMTGWVWVVNFYGRAWLDTWPQWLILGMIPVLLVGSVWSIVTARRDRRSLRAVEDTASAAQASPPAQLLPALGQGPA